jgi:fido (protein-threonine AMPylation protein)
VSDIFEEPDDTATSLAEEKRNLIPTHIAFRSDLNAAEQENIARSQEWAMRQRTKDLLDEKLIKNLHRRMFADVWK